MDLGKKLQVFGKIKILGKRLVEECSVLWRDIRVLAFSKKKNPSNLHAIVHVLKMSMSFIFIVAFHTVSSLSFLELHYHVMLN